MVSLPHLMVRDRLQLIHLAVGQDKKDNLIFIAVSFCVFLLKFVFTQWQETGELKRFFVFDGQLLSTSAYIDYFATCWTYIIIYLLMMFCQPKSREYIFYITFFWIAYFIEFYIMYNNPFFFVGRIPFGISTGIGIGYIILFTREALRK